MNATLDFPALVAPFKFSASPYEYKVTPFGRPSLNNAAPDLALKA
jgi:hypothetical protein